MEEKVSRDKSPFPQDRFFHRDYGIGGDPYGSYLEEDKGYYASDGYFFAPISKDNRLHPKAVVVGIRDKKGNAAAVLKDYLRQNKAVELMLGEKKVRIIYDEELDFYEVENEAANAFDSMWFPWASFYPDTSLLK